MMFQERSITADGAHAGVGRGTAVADVAVASGRYTVRCVGSDGTLKWSEEISNLVTTQGRNDALDKHLSGVGYTANWYVGLISATGYTSGPQAEDTAALHAGWLEEVGFSGSRPAASFAAAATGTKSLATPSVFAITADVVVRGCFLSSSSTKGGAGGVLYSAGLFSQGNKTIQNGDTLNVSYSASLT